MMSWQERLEGQEWTNVAIPKVVAVMPGRQATGDRLDS